MSVLNLPATSIMFSDDSDSSWEKLGRENPYYGVLSADEFRGAPPAELRTNFFQSGEKHVAWLESCAARYFGGFQTRRSALDFGCGVGRVAIPLGRTFDKVVGVDVSPSMLDEAERNCARFSITNVTFDLSDDALSRIDGTFDFVHSVITFQHIPADRGEKIIERLIDVVTPGGIVAFQFYFQHRARLAHRIVRGLRRRFVPLHWLLNVVRRRPWRDPLMQHNVYDIGRILSRLSARGIEDVYIHTTAIGGAFLFARKPNKGQD